jgi:hypothetical protein
VGSIPTTSTTTRDGGGIGRRTRLKICWAIARGGSSPPRPIKINNIKENVMSYTIQTSYCWYDEGNIIVKMYFLENIPFTFDEMPDGHLLDQDLVKEANKNPSYEPDDVYKGSNYLMMEGMHPCFDNIDEDFLG